MRIVTRQQLLEMPRGTLFAEAFDPCNYGPLCIFGGEFGPDFTERSITACESDGSEQYIERSQEMWETGASYPVNTDYGREGMFDDSMRYLVYEPADIESIISELHRGQS